MLSFYGLLEASLLILNGIAILHRERFLKKYGLGAPSHSFDSEPGVKTQVINLICAVQTVMRSESLLLRFPLYGCFRKTFSVEEIAIGEMERGFQREKHTGQFSEE